MLAIEPSPEMARVARSNCAGYDAVEIVESDLESWQPPEPRAALVSAQAWQWINPEVRSARAHRALRPGGTLAAIWTFPDRDRCSSRDALSDAYRTSAPLMPAIDRAALLGTVAGAIEASGGGLSLPFATYVCLASRA